MATPPLSDEQVLEAVAALAAADGVVVRAAQNIGMTRGRMEGRLREARRRGFIGDGPRQAPDINPSLTNEMVIASLRKQLRDAQAGATLQHWAKSVIHAADENARLRGPARWLGERQATPSAAGIPTLLLSDLHWGEVVRGSEIADVNHYDLDTAQTRLRSVVEKTMVLLRDHVIGDYPGIVVCLGGDMISGSIHDELLQTNEGTVMQQTLDLFEHLQTAITKLADEFGRVHLPCVTGNHGRSNKKWQAKQRAHLSYEWLLYQFLERAFKDDERITWQIPEGPDTDWEIVGTRYRLTHGDTFKGGDGIIGPIGPVTRGTLKRGRMADAMGAPFDVLLLGHWHTLTWGANFVINGSLKGFDEFAMSLSITPEPPAQALWLTTEKHGRTIQLPVYA
jgi:hypothetical protein